MSRHPTIADVATAAGVSKAAVSMALSGKGRVSEKTRTHIRHIAEELGYRPSVRAQRLRGGRSQSVALMTALPDVMVGRDSHLSFLLGLAFPLTRVLLEHGYSMLLLPPLNDYRQLDVIDADGVVLVDPRRSDPLCADFRRRGMQVVTIGNVPDLEAHGIVERGYSGADVSIQHLLSQGARHILVMVSSEEYSVISNVRRFVAEFDSPAEARLSLAEAPAASGEEGGYHVARKLLEEDPTIDAIYAPMDAFAVGALHAAQQVGREVPRDLMISTNFDGPRATGSAPPLTALDLDLNSLAQAAAGLLMDCLASPSGAQRTVAVPPPSLLPRDSTARVSLQDFSGESRS